MNLKRAILLLSICIFSLTGCDLISSGDEEISPEQALTAVFQTVEAALSLTPQATNTNTATATATATTTVTLTPSPSLTNSPTVVVASSGEDTGGQASGGCDNATFVSDVSVPDNTQFAPGTTYTKTWRLRNSGTCSWTSAYGVFYTGGTQMSGVSPQIFGHLDSSDPKTIAPGKTLDIVVELTAPQTAGTYTGYWQMQNAAGASFGDQFYVQIVVTGDAVETMTPTVTATGPTPTASATSAGGSGKPDLRITRIQFDPSPERGKQFTVRVDVENQGGGDAGAFLVEWWSDEGNDDDATKKTWNVSSLAAGEKRTLEHSCSCYDNSGNYTSRALADAVGQVDESDEGNNEMTSSVSP